MKPKMFDGIEREHLIRSAIYLVSAVVMMVVSFPAGILNGYSFGILLFNIGLIVCLYAVLRPWGKAKYYFILFAVFFVIFSVLQIVIAIIQFELTEGIMWFSGGICTDVFIGTIIGIVVFSEGFLSLIYSAATVALFAIFIMFPQTLSPDKALRYSTLISAYIFLILQFASVLAFSLTASIAERRRTYPKIVILISGIILILMGVWGIMEFEIKEWMFGIRIWSMLEIISGVLAIYSFAIVYFGEDQIH
jgi:hypothetical protein